MMSSIDLSKIDPDITLQEFLKILKENHFDFYSYRSDWNGDVRVKVNIDKFDGDDVRRLYFVFQNRSKDPRLQDIEVDFKDKFGVWTSGHYNKFHRPWYKGGSIL